MKVGDLVSVEYKSERNGDWNFIGVCTWTDGYKYEFITNNGDAYTWTRRDLETVNAKVISEMEVINDN